MMQTFASGIASHASCNQLEVLPIESPSEIRVYSEDELSFEIPWATVKLIQHVLFVISQDSEDTAGG